MMKEIIIEVIIIVVAAAFALGSVWNDHERDP
jgi:hypothetical protein